MGTMIPIADHPPPSVRVLGHGQRGAGSEGAESLEQGGAISPASVSHHPPDTTTLCTSLLSKSSSSSSSSCDRPPELPGTSNQATVQSGHTHLGNAPTPAFLEGLPDYKIRKLVGNGSFGVVYSAKCLRTNERVAVKSLDKLRISKRSLKATTTASPATSPATSASGIHGNMEVRVTNFSAECSFLRNLVPPHPNIIRLIDVVETEAVLHMVMEYLPRGDMHKQLAGFGSYKEEDARPLFSQLVNAVGYLHEKGWVHRDIKLDNILLTNDGMQIRLCDFGLTVRYSWSTPLKSFAGSPPFAAPEVHFGWDYFGPEADIWSLGVVLYTMLTSSLPFDGKDFKSLRQTVWQANPNLPKTLSMEAVQLLRSCFARNPAHRTDVGLITDSHWLRGTKLASPAGAVHASLCPMLDPSDEQRNQVTDTTTVDPSSEPSRGRQTLRIATNHGNPPPIPAAIRGRSLGPPLSAGPMGPSDPNPSLQRPRARSIAGDARRPGSPLSQLGAPTGIVGSQMGSWLGLSDFTNKMAGMRLGVLRGSLRRLVDGVVGSKSAGNEDLLALPVSLQASTRSRSQTRVRSSARSRSPVAGTSRSMDALHEQHEEDQMEGGGTRPFSVTTSLGNLDHELAKERLAMEQSNAMLLTESLRDAVNGHDVVVPLPMASGFHWFFPIVVMVIGVVFSWVFGVK